MGDRKDFQDAFRKRTGYEEDDKKKKEDEGDSASQTAKELLSMAGSGLKDLATGGAAELMGMKKKKKD